MNVNLIIIIGALGFLNIILVIWLIITEIRLKKIFRGKKGANLETVLKSIGDDLGSLQEAKKRIEDNISQIDTRLKKAVKNVGTVRFNPFKDSGGNQSFASAFINEDGDGVVISSMYSRERVSVFAKPIEKFKAEYDLTKEEQEALKKAQSD